MWHGSQELNKSTPECGLKLLSAIGGDCGKNTKAQDPGGYKRMSYDFCCDAGDGDCFQPPCKMINAGEDVSVTS